MRDDMRQGSTAGELARLDDLEDFKVADGDPDVRGWAVTADDGRKVGKVDSLIVDTTAMKVRYLGVELDKQSLKLQKDRSVLIPIGDARLDDHKDDIRLGSKTMMQLSSLLEYQPGKPITPGQTPPPKDADAKQFYGKRGGTGEIQRMVLSEEKLKVGKRQTHADDLEVRKTVETEHVSQKVPLMHEEVTIERRPVSPDTADPDGIKEGEVRIPLMAEEAVVEKREVAKEELVITKKQVQGEKTVEADLKSEKVETKGGVDVKPGSQPGRDAPEPPAR